LIAQTWSVQLPPENSGQESEMGVADKFRLDGKVALVTGASSGLGAHFAATLASQGAQVVVAARRAERLAALAAQISAAGGRAHPVDLDVTDAASVEAAVASVVQVFGALDILINNAGIGESASFLTASETHWRDHIGVNLDGVARVGRAVARHMAASGKGGSIVNVASIAGILVTKGLSAYSVTKAAVIQLTRAMALELAPNSIRVNALAPGYFPTELTEALLASDRGKQMLARFPMQRAGRLEELDGALLLLASDAGSYITGSTLVVDGGTLLVAG
jgi:NAD(P)-dependent dehydrogenase (short-subunit alcohol dehydrogenase family)